MSDERYGVVRVPMFVEDEKRPVCGGCGHVIERGEVFGWQLVGSDGVMVGCADCVMEDHAAEPEERVWPWQVAYGFAGAVPFH